MKLRGILKTKECRNWPRSFSGYTTVLQLGFLRLQGKIISFTFTDFSSGPSIVIQSISKSLFYHFHLAK